MFQQKITCSWQNVTVALLFVNFSKTLLNINNNLIDLINSTCTGYTVDDTIYRHDFSFPLVTPDECPPTPPRSDFPFGPCLAMCTSDADCGSGKKCCGECPRMCIGGIFTPPPFITGWYSDRAIFKNIRAQANIIDN